MNNLKGQLISRIKSHLNFKTVLEQEFGEKSQKQVEIFKDLHAKGDELDANDYKELKTNSILVNLLQEDVVKVTTKVAELYMLYTLNRDKEDVDDFSEEQEKVLNSITETDTFIHYEEKGTLKYKTNGMLEMMTSKFENEPFDKEQIMGYVAKINKLMGGNI